MNGENDQNPGLDTICPAALSNKFILINDIAFGINTAVYCVTA
jgi:hypothetical protein